MVCDDEAIKTYFRNDEQDDDDFQFFDEVAEHLDVHPIHVKVGRDLKPPTSPQEDDIYFRIHRIRKQLASELGFILPRVPIQMDENLVPRGYTIFIRETSVAQGELGATQYLATANSSVTEEVTGQPTQHPVTAKPSIWIDRDQAEKADSAGYTVVDALEVLTTHLMEICKRYAHRILTRQDVQHLIDRIQKRDPVLVEGVIPQLVPLGIVHKVLQNLLKDGISIRDLSTLLEVLADQATTTQDVDTLTQYVLETLNPNPDIVDGSTVI